MDKLKEFILRKRVVKDSQTTEIKEVKIPWYKRPLERSEFYYRKAINDKLYVRHEEWAKHTWIGPYDTKKDVENVVDAYVRESFKAPLDRKENRNIHSITVENEPQFFGKTTMQVVI